MKNLIPLLLILSFISCAPKIKPPKQIGAWIVYWDVERGIQELEKHGSLFDKVSLFAYELEPEGNLIYPPGFKEVLPRFIALADEKGFSPWVTIVNDVRTSKGVILKDASTIRKILNDPILRTRHIQNLIKQLKNDGFLGVDLDYEAIDYNDNEIFNNFLKELYAELRKEGLELNVILEPSRHKVLPKADLTKVTVMAYNLHGPNTGPGPRSTTQFISKLSKRGEVDINKAPWIALATGGFSWSNDGKISQVDWVTAKNLAMKSSKSGRDIKSNVPYAILENGEVIWYEDVKSLEHKWIASYKAGYRNLMIWRLGGNDDDLFDLLFNIKNYKNINK